MLPESTVSNRPQASHQLRARPCLASVVYECVLQKERWVHLAALKWHHLNVLASSALKFCLPSLLIRRMSRQWVQQQLYHDGASPWLVRCHLWIDQATTTCGGVDKLWSYHQLTLAGQQSVDVASSLFGWSSWKPCLFWISSGSSFFYCCQVVVQSYAWVAAVTRLWWILLKQLKECLSYDACYSID